MPYNHDMQTLPERQGMSDGMLPASNNGMGTLLNQTRNHTVCKEEDEAAVREAFATLDLEKNLCKEGDTLADSLGAQPQKRNGLGAWLQNGHWGWRFWQ